MSIIRKVIPGKNLPFTTVEDALKYGNGKVMEAQTLRNAQLRIQENMLAAERAERGGVPEPFNFTKVLQRLFAGKKEENAIDQGNDPDRGRKGDVLQKAKNITEISQTDNKAGIMQEVQEEKEVHADEKGAVAEKKAHAPRAAVKEAEHAGIPKNTVKTVVAGSPDPSIDSTAPLFNASEDKGYGNIVPMKAGSPQELRLGRGIKRTVPGAVREQEVKAGQSGVSTNNKAEAYKDSPATETEKETTQRGPGRVMTETAYKPAPQKIIEEQDQTPQEKQAEKRIETETTKVLVKSADALKAVVRAAELNRQENTGNIDTDQMQRPKHAENRTSAGQSKESPLPSLEKTDLGGLLMKAAVITHVTGRELQFDKGRDYLKIKKEGNETFAFINGRKVGMDEAKKYMKDLGKELGPEKTQRLAVMISDVAGTPNMTMEQALGGKNPTAEINPQIKEKGLEVPER